MLSLFDNTIQELEDMFSAALAITWMFSTPEGGVSQYGSGQPVLGPGCSELGDAGGECCGSLDCDPFVTAATAGDGGSFEFGCERCASDNQGGMTLADA